MVLAAGFLPSALGDGETGTGSPQEPALSDIQGAAIIGALLREQTQIDIGKFGLEASQTEALMEAAGIPCKRIVGYANGSHSWNQVQIDGAWYHVDVTWDDPIPDREGYVRYDYFLKSDDYMRSNQHTIWYSGCQPERGADSKLGCPRLFDEWRLSCLREKETLCRCHFPVRFPPLV